MLLLRGPKEKKERALGERLGLKADRSLSPKSAMVKKPYKPGQHGNNRKRGVKALSDFGLQLKEKQKMKISYGLNENQLVEIFKKAIKAKTNTKERLINVLERRLDNVVFRMGLAQTRIIARKIILDGHISVNGRKVTFPNFQVKIKDVVSINENSKDKAIFKNLKEKLEKYDAPIWILVDPSILGGKISSLPTDVELPFDVNLITEFYSK
ncbi:MAG: 30S ribosomal protein S4 [Candidatus Pacebacteria bacterium]|nr:30S ribosomal protein S4 [Candidatus Paceibacterota bacterium]